MFSAVPVSFSRLQGINIDNSSHAVINNINNDNQGARDPPIQIFINQFRCITLENYYFFPKSFATSTFMYSFCKLNAINMISNHFLYHLQTTILLH